MAMTREHESDLSSRMVADGLDTVCLKYFSQLFPMAFIVSDASDGIYNGTMRRGSSFATCYPHIVCEHNPINMEYVLVGCVQ